MKIIEKKFDERPKTNKDSDMLKIRVTINNRKPFIVTSKSVDNAYRRVRRLRIALGIAPFTTGFQVLS